MPKDNKPAKMRDPRRRNCTMGLPAENSRLSSAPWMGALLALGALLVLPRPATAQPGADFYKGKTINLLIGVNVGGSYDRDARLVARYLGSHIPGNPTIVPQNMIGGGGIVMANYLQAIAPK